MSNYKEIVTKAVIGKGKKYFKNKYSVKSEVVPSTILGCWIINHKFKGYVQGDDVVVDGIQKQMLLMKQLNIMNLLMLKQNLM